MLRPLIDLEIERAIEQITGRQLSTAALRRHLERFAARVSTAARSDALLSIRSAEDAAEAWGVSLRRAQAHIAWLHERKGVGARIGRAWLITADEIERYRPGEPGRPHLAEDD